VVSILICCVTYAADLFYMNQCVTMFGAWNVDPKVRTCFFYVCCSLRLQKPQTPHPIVPITDFSSDPSCAEMHLNDAHTIYAIHQSYCGCGYPLEESARTLMPTECALSLSGSLLEKKPLTLRRRAFHCLSLQLILGIRVAVKK
jgi:hypothetical protein